jgi:hypothetical protein
MIKNLNIGDIVRVRARDAQPQLVALWDVSRPKYVQGILIHTSPEMATDEDVVLARKTTEPIEVPAFLRQQYPDLPEQWTEERLVGTVTPYPLVLCCDLYGQFLRTQVDARVANVGAFPVGHPLLRPAEIATALGGYRGLPIWHNSPRWNEKVRLLEEDLRPLTYPFWQGFRW